MPFTKGHPPYFSWKGKKRSEETNNKIRETLKKLYDSPEKHPQYKGKILRSGYYYIKQPNHPFAGKQGYIAYHRLVMEKYLGRFLKQEEAIHHKNGNKLDNGIENLEVFSSHGEHTKQAHNSLFEELKIKFKGKHFSPATEWKKRDARFIGNKWNRNSK